MIPRAIPHDLLLKRRSKKKTQSDTEEPENDEALVIAPEPSPPMRARSRSRDRGPPVSDVAPAWADSRMRHRDGPVPGSL